MSDVPRTTMHRLLTPADYRRMPWKDGGGQTTEFAVHPEGATLSSFVWRVSTADVTRDGAFSRFPGVDRTLVLLAGRGLRLEGAGEPMVLRALYEPIRFAGDSALACTLVEGPVRDFNLMVRRDVAAGEVVVARGGGQTIAPASVALCYAASGRSECLLAGNPPIALAPEHALLVTAGAPGLTTAFNVYPTAAESVVLVAVISLRGGTA